VSPEINELIVSFFGNGYITYLDVEITDHIYENRKVSKEEFIRILRHRGYRMKDITEELDRQCYASTLRYIPSEDAYVSIDMGRFLWRDILERIHEQKSMLGGRLEKTNTGLKLDVYRTDFQSLKFKRLISNLGLHQAPVMRWTKQFRSEEALNCLDKLVGAVPCSYPHGKADRSVLLQVIHEVNKHKSKKTTWAWLITHPVMQLKLTPSREKVIKTLFSLSKGPVDWKGRPVSFDELKRLCRLSEEIQESIEYFEVQGVVRYINDKLTPTGQGYVLLQYALKDRPSLTFVVVHVEKTYRLEISAPTLAGHNIRDILKELGGRSFSEVNTPIVFSECEKSEVITLMDSIIRSGF